MALARVKTWSSGEVLTASDLNAEFNNLLNNARDLISPLTASLDMDGKELILDGDADSSLTADTDDRLDVRLGGVDLFILNGTATSPVNGLQFIAGATGTRAVIDSGITGSDSNVGFTLLASGTGPVCIDNDTDPVDLRFLGAAGANNKITDVNGNEIVILAGTASAVNEITITNAATGDPAILAASGETNVTLDIRPKGSGVVRVTDGTDVTKKASFVLSGISASTVRTITMPDANVDLQYARASSDTVAGGIEIATQSEVETATDTGRAMTPGRTQYHPGVAKAWVDFSLAGGGATVNASRNVTSVTRNSAGDYTITFTTAFSAANYAISGALDDDGANYNRRWFVKASGRAAGACTVIHTDDTGTPSDTGRLSFVFFGDQ